MLRELPSGRDASRSERELRAGWEEAAGHVSRDPRFIRQLFALLQEVECLPRPQDGGREVHDGFTLSPARKPVDFSFAVAADSRRSRILGALAAAGRAACTLEGVLVNDPLVELVKGFNQLGPSLRWEDDGRLICVPDRAPVAADKALLDRAVHVGDDLLNFFLLLFVMSMRPCRLKMMGESALKLADLSEVRRFLPLIGARFTSIVPGQDGLPARLEASGILPTRIEVPVALPADAELALCIGLACTPRSHGVTVQLAARASDSVRDEVLEVLRLAGIAPEVQGRELFFAPGQPELLLPQTIDLPMDLHLAVTLLALPAALGGVARVQGTWPENARGQAAWRMLEVTGLALSRDGQGVSATRAEQGTTGQSGLASLCAADAAVLGDLAPLAAALAVLPALSSAKKGESHTIHLPAWAVIAGETDEFLARLGLECVDGVVCKPEGAGEVGAWSCPSPIWAFALAVAACAKPGVQLVNPGVVTAHMPGFWQWYNGLPSPVLRHEAAPVAPAAPGRRRILAGFMPENQMPEPLAEDDTW